jgi:predicted secreted protein
MSRSRSFNRFHRYLARQKRRAMRSALPRFRDHDEMMVYPIDHTRQVLSRLWGKEMKLELEESEV